MAKLNTTTTPPSPSTFWTPPTIFLSATLLRILLLIYGLLQDAYSPLKYTDIDYFVFTDAARYTAQGLSPYHRETYRYTPLLAWLLIPTTWGGTLWFSFGKILFSVADIVAGWLLVLLLRSPQGGRMPSERALKFASIWLLNPMVATISTRGSSEGLLGVMVTALLWSVTNGRLNLAGFLLGLSVHFKIYPFIYAPSLVLFLESPVPAGTPVMARLRSFLNREHITLASSSLLTFSLLTGAMYAAYGMPFLQHTYFHHVTRIDHRHNFSPYNTLLYASSATAATSSHSSSFSTGALNLESLAFLPQLSLSAILLPLALAKHHLPSAMLAQTWAFVALNKVCTSQYFLWYLSLLPLYLPYSGFLRRPVLGVGTLVLWIAAQAWWLQQGFQLEFMGESTFVPGLWGAGLGFYVVNMYILGVIVDDVKALRDHAVLESEDAKEKGTR